MFTGLVLETARVTENTGGCLRVLSQLPEIKHLPLGASVAVNGACLTVVELFNTPQGSELKFDVSPETLARTNLGGAKEQVHLELPLALGQALGGHLLTGHVDACGEVHALFSENKYLRMQVSVQGPARDLIAPFLVSKASIAVDGVSLTVNEVQDLSDKSFFEVTLIPHTLELTRFAKLKVGDAVNLEADLVAKYVNRHKSYFAEFSVKGIHP